MPNSHVILLAGLLGLAACNGDGLTADEQLARYNTTEAAIRDAAPQSWWHDAAGNCLYCDGPDATAPDSPLQPVYMAPATPLGVQLLGVASRLLAPPTVVIQSSGMGAGDQMLLHQYLVDHTRVGGRY